MTASDKFRTCPTCGRLCLGSFPHECAEERRADLRAVEPVEEPALCAAEVRRATYYDPPEFCENDAVEGSEFCEGHDPDAYDDWLAERAEARKEDER